MALAVVRDTGGAAGPMAATMNHSISMTLVVTSRSSGTAGLQQFRTLGIEPLDIRVIVAKGVHSPRPAMEPIARQLIWVSPAQASRMPTWAASATTTGAFRCFRWNAPRCGPEARGATGPAARGAHCQ